MGQEIKWWMGFVTQVASIYCDLVANRGYSGKASLLSCRSQKMLRVTVREDFSYELATDLVNDLKQVIEWLDHHFIYSGVPSSVFLGRAIHSSRSACLTAALP